MAIDSSKDKEWQKQMEIMAELYEKEIKLHVIATFNGKEYELENLLNSLLNKLKEKDKGMENIKFYIEQSDIKNMLWGKEILKIIDREEK